MLQLNLLLTIVWLLLTEDSSLGNLVMGFLFAFAILSFSEMVITFQHQDDPETPPSQAERHTSTPIRRQGSYFNRTRLTFVFIIFFLKELVIASINVLLSIIQPHRIHPGVIAVPLDLYSDMQITLLANVVSLTPGTLSLDLSDDKKIIFIHSIFVKDPDDFRHQIKDGFERRILDIVEA